MKKSYPCVRVRQTPQSKELLLFSASAIDIDAWVGIPQRLSLSGVETAGFQRTVSPAREQALRKFFAEPRNVIQNPLLCAIRQAPGIKVSFESTDDSALGQVTIEFDDSLTVANQSTADLLRAVRISLENRVPGLIDRICPENILIGLQAQISLISVTSNAMLIQDPESEEDLEGMHDEEEETFETEMAEPAEEALFDESQITDFWDQLFAREFIASKVESLKFANEVLGFSREMLESYLRPVILVDGQHRLAGAVLAARDAVDESSEAQGLIVSGLTPIQAREQLLSTKAKELPISLLMNDSPAEHVFQYVVVNQKATPVPKALLGTIISTSLAAGELETIAERLEEAKIPLEGSRVVSILSRAPNSPFFNLVSKGMQDEGTNKLPWSVLSTLADIFRYLEGGRLFHETSDHAKIWRNHQFEKSNIVSDWHARGYSSAMEYWQDLNGPWLAVFKAFWTETRNKLANTTDPLAKNYWGDPRESNIFNKPSLLILTADFFSYLRETKSPIGSIEDVATLVDDWLDYPSHVYFAKDWKLSGVKKDSVGTRRQWSKLWANHRREGGEPPAAGQYRLLLKA